MSEIVITAQDTTAYGIDLYGEYALPRLLKELCKIDGIHWIRTLYTYPDKITDELLFAIRDEEKLLPYLDIPIQHCNDRILRRMNRKGSKKELSALISHIREIIPDITLRTTLITGFPTETEEEFCELAEFVKETRFDRLGCFAYSAEEDTVAAEMDGQVEEQTRLDRLENIMNEQMTIAAEKNVEKVGKVMEVLIEGYDNYIRCYYGRSVADAPEIDGKIFFITDSPKVIGDYIMVQINDSIEYDLLGEEYYESAE